MIRRSTAPSPTITPLLPRADRHYTIETGRVVPAAGTRSLPIIDTSENTFTAVPIAAVDAPAGPHRCDI
jgi:hypothetical protein